MEETKEKKRFSFPGVAWLKARLSRKILFITAIFIIVCLLLTSIIFLRYLREFVSVHYDRAIEETGRMADEVSSFLLGSDGETAALPAFLNARQLLCTVHDADGKLLFDSRDGAPDSVYSTVCAERTAFFKAVSEGEREFTAIAIAGGISGEAPVEYAYPCGICRQVMQEFCRDDFVIYVVNSEQDYQRYTLKELLPFGFGGDAIR